MNKDFFDKLPSIKKAKEEQKVYGRLFIPYTINNFYIMGADKINNDYKLFIVEKWKTPFVLKINYKEVLLSKLLLKYNNLKFDNKWNTIYISSIFRNIGNLYNITGV